MNKRTKTGLGVLAGVLALGNIMAYNHAGKFTHYDPAVAQGAHEPQPKGFLAMAGFILLGPHNGKPACDALPRIPYETVHFKGNENLEGWYIPAVANKGTILLFHGYMATKSSQLEKAYIFHDAGYNVLLTDFSGSGGSSGYTTTIGYKEGADVLGAYQWLLQQHPHHNLVLFGTSMGAAAITKCMYDHPELAVSAIILECPYGSLYQAVSNRLNVLHIPSFPLAAMMTFWGGVQNGFNGFEVSPEAFARKIKSPTLLMWGEKDNRVNREETESVYAALAGPKQLVTFPEAGHESYLLRYRQQWETATLTFLQRWVHQP
jgi:pimeloyl-ACP methyl ester carboxylesterase